MNPSPSQRAFWQAITVGDLETVQVLLEHGGGDIDVNAVDMTGEQRPGCSAIHLAILEMPTWRGSEGRNGIQTADFVRRFFALLLDYGADIDKVCQYGGEWFLQTAAGKTKSFFPEGQTSLGLVLQFIEITRGADVISTNVTKRLELIRDMLLDHIRQRSDALYGLTPTSSLSPSASASAASPHAGSSAVATPFGSHGNGTSAGHGASPPSASSSSSSLSAATAQAVALAATMGGAGSGFTSPSAATAAAVAAMLPPASLAADLARSLASRSFCDVEFRCQGEVVPAHRFVLASRSSVFAAMLGGSPPGSPKAGGSGGGGSFAESRTGVVNVDHVEPATLRAFVTFLYTDTLVAPAPMPVASSTTTPLLGEGGAEAAAAAAAAATPPATTPSPPTHASSSSSSSSSSWTLPPYDELLALSNMYDVPALKDACSSHLAMLLTVDNAAHVLRMADENQASALRARALHFISRHVEQVMVTESFAALDAELTKEVLQTLVRRQSSTLRRHTSASSTSSAPGGASSASGGGHHAPAPWNLVYVNPALLGRHAPPHAQAGPGAAADKRRRGGQP